MAATKETFVLHAAAAVGALILGILWDRRVSGERAVPRISWTHGAVFAGVAAAVWLVLFTSLFSNAEGPLDSIRTYEAWFRRAEGASPHNHPWWYYLELLTYQRVGRGPTWSEGLILCLAVAGAVAGLKGGGEGGLKYRWTRFIALYALLLTAIYSAIPYKTPWCLLGFHHSYILLAGVGAARLTERWSRQWMRLVMGLLLLGGSAQLAVQAYRTSYSHAENPRNPYVYAHTLSSVLGLVERVEALAPVDDREPGLEIKVMARGGDYWPLPWYFRGFARVGWWSEIAADPIAPVLIVSPGYGAELEGRLAATHVMTGYYGLRPGVFLQLYVERGLWERYLATKE
jgi:hypothetical protein